MHQSDQNTDRQSATLPHPQQPELMTDEFIQENRAKQARNRGGEAPLENVSPPWKNVLDTVSNHWTQFKKFGPLSENSSPLLVSQAGSGTGAKYIKLTISRSEKI